MGSISLIAFVTTYIFYLNNYQLDYGLMLVLMVCEVFEMSTGWNMKMCVVTAVAQLFIWCNLTLLLRAFSVTSPPPPVSLVFWDDHLSF
ncbi:hypothetical protein Vadar_013746 [Vaccinium darrowii]|uniref:Uncharacterized protein n=1 Tax=Vaccinium darrowii TaxID=229202 RepID=A0ACB7Z3W2_9ERIC|nr:hypothetical protein Vadar_013746 [Vaccinium darrowii]